VEGHGVEGRDARAEGGASVLPHEEGRVVEAGAHHALVAAADGVGVEGGVDHREKARQELAPAHRAHRALDGEVALVAAHHALDERVGQVEEALVEAPHHHGGPLHEARDLALQKRVAAQGAALRRRRRQQRLKHGLPPHRGVRLHLRGSERGLVARRVGQGDGLRREEAVAVAHPPRLDAREGQRHDGIVKQGDDPLDGPTEGRLLTGPAHRLGEAHPAEGGGERRGQERQRGGAGGALDGAEVAPLGSVDEGEGFKGQVVLLGEAFGGAGPGPLGVDGGGCGGAEQLLLARGNLRGDALHHDGYATRRAHRAHGAKAHTRPRKLLGNQLPELPHRILQERRRELLAPDLQQQRRCHALSIFPHRVGPRPIAASAPPRKAARARAPLLRAEGSRYDPGL
jgi:hypothetical protein